mgnify:CR=1 FL=1
MAKAKQGLVRGMGTHRRTEGDYMAALLDTVTLDDWRDVVAGALQLAKGGDAQARAWLAQYLVGKASASAPTALTVQVNQWSGKDPLAERLARLVDLLAERAVEFDPRDLVSVDRCDVRAVVEEAAETLDPDETQPRQHDEEQERHHQALVITEEIEHA